MIHYSSLWWACSAIEEQLMKAVAVAPRAMRRPRIVEVAAPTPGPTDVRVMVSRVGIVSARIPVEALQRSGRDAEGVQRGKEIHRQRVVDRPRQEAPARDGHAGTNDAYPTDLREPP